MATGSFRPGFGRIRVVLEMAHVRVFRVGIPIVVPAGKGVSQKLHDPWRQGSLPGGGLATQIVEKVLCIVVLETVFATNLEELVDGYGQGVVAFFQRQFLCAGHVPEIAHVRRGNGKVFILDKSRPVAQHASQGHLESFHAFGVGGDEGPHLPLATGWGVAEHRALVYDSVIEPFLVQYPHAFHMAALDMAGQPGSPCGPGRSCSRYPVRSCFQGFPSRG